MAVGHHDRGKRLPVTPRLTSYRTMGWVDCCLSGSHHYLGRTDILATYQHSTPTGRSKHGTAHERHTARIPTSLSVLGAIFRSSSSSTRAVGLAGPSFLTPSSRHGTFLCTSTAFFVPVEVLHAVVQHDTIFSPRILLQIQEQT